MILPIFLTNQFLSAKSTGKDTKEILYKLFPIEDVFSPFISNKRIREILKESLDEKELKDFKPVILSISDNNYDVEPEYDFVDILEHIPFSVIVPEYYYPQAINFLSQAEANIFLNCKKYGLEIPEDIRVKVDSIAVAIYTKDNVGKFISQNQIVISTTNIDSKAKPKYIESVIKALSDNIQIAGVWSIFVDFNYQLFPNMLEALESEAPIDEFLNGYIKRSDGKLIIAPGVKEAQVGEGEEIETVELTDTKLNQFKISEEEKTTFKWKSDKSKFEGEVYGSQTGIKIDVRERPKQK